MVTQSPSGLCSRGKKRRINVTSKLVAVLDAKSSKADEVAALRKMAQCAGEGSYLSSLLTPELLDWVKGQIELDCPPDIMEQCNFRAEKQGELMSEIHGLRQQVASAHRDAGWAAKEVSKRHQRELADMQARFNQQRGTADYWQDEAQAARAKAEAYRDSVLWAWGWVGWLMVKRDEAECLIKETKVKAFAMLEKALLDKPQEEAQ